MRELSERERAVALLVAQGLTDAQIGYHLSISQQRVSQIVQHIADKWQLDRERSIRIQIAVRFSQAA